MTPDQKAKWIGIAIGLIVGILTLVVAPMAVNHSICGRLTVCDDAEALAKGEDGA